MSLLRYTLYFKATQLRYCNVQNHTRMSNKILISFGNNLYVRIFLFNIFASQGLQLYVFLNEFT